ncbi:TIGR01906 family membrane protein [Saxibacter everestensis]|uniref:TIGR01906 family membrane protein n=1 Tax=Saxibacter everestensis TaxID=2909229 RepID=A0ABY8QP81_9MICO|nr:TIGR01906 family membrane protein [Brevibacteriaceae bacterium ZFBP1038]
MTSTPDPAGDSTNDLVTRRMNSRSRTVSADDRESVPATGTSGLGDSERPAILSEEEWAELTGGAPQADRSADSPSASSGSQSGTTGSGAGPAPISAHREVDVPRARPRSAGGKPEASGWLPTLAKIWIAISTPIVLIALAIRMVASPLFMRFEYFWRPGFPADEFGFSADDRQHYGSYVVDYLLNFDGIRYLADIRLADGSAAFKAGELSHMHDVKAVFATFNLVAIILLVVSIVFAVYLARRTERGLRMGLFLGGIVTVVFIGAAAALALIGWERFFTTFHQLFFAEGTWTFHTNDTLIRLYPGTFWTDGGILIGGFTLLVALLLIGFAWPRRRAARR